MFHRKAKAGSGWPLFQLWEIAVLTSFIMATYGFGRNIFPIILPDMKDELRLSYSTVGVITAMHQAGYLCFSILGARLTKVVDPRAVVIGSVGLCGVGLLALAVARETWVIGTIMTGLGLCAATSWVPMVALVASRYSYESRSRVLAIVSCGTAYGIFINGIVIPPVQSNYGWQSVWTVSGLVVIVLTAIGLLTFSKNRLARPPSSANLPSGATDGGFRALPLLCAIMFVSGLTLIPFQTYLVPFVRDELGYSLDLGGQAWSLMGLFGMASGLLLALIADRTTVRRALVGCYLSLAVACAVLVLWPAKEAILMSSALFGVVYFGLFGLHPAYVSRISSPERAAIVFGTANLALGLGSATGNYIGGLTKDHWGTFLILYWAIAGAMLLLALLCGRLEPDAANAPASKKA